MAQFMPIRFDSRSVPLEDLNEIAADEVLDSLDPLRHLRNDTNDLAEYNDEGTVVIPPQPRSILGDMVQLSFPAESPLVSISLKVDASPGCGGIAWPAGEVLSNYISFRGIGYLEGKKIVELGSGTGLVGLVAGALGGSVWITDQAPLLDIMHQNVELNNLQSHVSVCELNWGEKLPSEIPPPELILAADCVYFEPAFPLLVQTLSDMAVSDTVILFCYKKRRKVSLSEITLDDVNSIIPLIGRQTLFHVIEEKVYLERGAKHISVPCIRLKTNFQVEDDPNREIYNSEAISLLTLTKRPCA